MGTVNLNYKGRDLEITFYRHEPVLIELPGGIGRTQAPHNELTVIRDERGKDITREYDKEEIKELTTKIN